MLKIIRVEILIIVILLLGIVISHNFNIYNHNYFSNLKQTLQQDYLIDFFKNINILGNSVWYFMLSIIFIIFCYLLRRKRTIDNKNDNIKRIQYLSYLLFLSVLISGMLAQIIKHAVGRPRPNMINIGNDLTLNFFSLDSNFHSFPSGHTTTIFAVVLVISLIAPKLRYFFYIFAALVSFSRFVLDAHFITDLLGGIAVAFIGFKIAILILSKFFNIDKEGLVFIKDNFKLSFLILFLLSFLLTIGPTFDIFFSKLFQNYNGSFFLQKNYFNIEILNYNRGINPTILFRKLFLPIIIIYIFILPLFSKFLFLNKLYFGHIFKLRELIYLWLTSLVGLIVLINIIFKNFWGRSRPNDISDLGGTNKFTPWYEITDQCIKNCSFVSGDSSLGFAIIIFYFLTRKTIYLWAALTLGVFLGLIRIMEGGHFISDVILAGTIIFIYYYLCYSFYIKKFNV